MKTSLHRLANSKLRDRYLIIIKNYPLEERPWPEREDKILEDFFLTDKTYQQIGSEIGTSMARVAQLLTPQIRRLLHPSGLRKYWDKNYDPNAIIFATNMIKEPRIKIEMW